MFNTIKINKLEGHINIGQHKLSNGKFLMNASGSMEEVLEASRQISERINKPGAKCWDDNFITITMQYQGRFKTNRSRVNFWFNGCK